MINSTIRLAISIATWFIHGWTNVAILIAANKLVIGGILLLIVVVAIVTSIYEIPERWFKK